MEVIFTGCRSGGRGGRVGKLTTNGCGAPCMGGGHTCSPHLGKAKVLYVTKMFVTPQYSEIKKKKLLSSRIDNIIYKNNVIYEN